LRRIRVSTVAVEKVKYITYCDCVFVALGIQHTTRMRHIVICGLSGFQYFFTLSHKGKILEEKKSY
jgi:hypothetical protein